MAEPAVAPEATAPGSADPSAGDPRSHVEQFRTDPEKGVRMYSDAQARADRAEAALKRYENLNGYVEKYGEKLPEVIQNFEAITSNQDLVKGILHFNEHGRFPGDEQPNKPEAQVADEYLTEEERALKEELQTLRGEFSSLQKTLQGMTGSLGQDSLQRNLVSASHEMGLPPEVHARVMKSLQGEFADLERANPNQLQSLIGPRGKEVIERAIKQHLTMDDFEKIVEHKRTARANELRRFETDGPSEVRTQGSASVPDLKSMSVSEAFQWALDNPDAHDSR